MEDLDFGDTIRALVPNQRLFSRYVLERFLGRGGMGIVWLARDEVLGGQVALKMLPEVLALDAEALADLKRETRRCLQLTHPAIVRIFDLVGDSQRAAIAMEFIDGGTLSARKAAQAGGHFGVEEITPWTEQLCAALGYAHEEAQVVHRDLKPPNLMLTRQGRLKIADFGVARSVTDSVSRVSAARDSSSSGTPPYMSPQQLMGERVCVADDIYALGATLYDLLTGKPPFFTGNLPMQILQKQPPPMTVRRRELRADAALPEPAQPIPPAWEAVVASCLAKEPGERPASVAECAERLFGGGVGKTTRLSRTRSLAPPPPPTAEAPLPVLPMPLPPPVQPAPSSPSLPAAAAPRLKHVNRRSGLWLMIIVVGAIMLIGVPIWYFGRILPEQRLAKTPQPITPSTETPRNSAGSEPGEGGGNDPQARDRQAREEADARRRAVEAQSRVDALEAQQRALRAQIEADEQRRAAAATADTERRSAVASPRPAPPSTVPASSAGPRPLAVYRARLSAQDHVSSSGARLTTVNDILRQDRANWHRFHRPDVEDEGDPLFGDMAARARFDRLSFRGSDDDARAAILHGTPLVEVSVYQNGVSVVILAP